MKAERQLFLLINNEAQGPFTEREVLAKLRAEEIGYGTLITENGAAEWLPLHEVLKYPMAKKESSLRERLKTATGRATIGFLVAAVVYFLAFVLPNLYLLRPMVMLVALAAMVLIGYFLPYFIALDRNHRNLTAITIVNACLGWTILGWVGSLVWAVIEQERRDE